MKKFIFAAIVFILSSIAFYNYLNFGSIFGKLVYEEIKLVDLLSFAKAYDNKNICTQGFYYQTDKTFVLKVKLEDDLYTGSSWIENNTSKSQIMDDFNPERGRVAEAKICGKFETEIDGQFGDPPAWRHKIIAETFEPLSESFRFKY